MAALKRRNRLLALRLTDDEYERLRTACDIAGGHSLSEYARSELLNSVENSWQTIDQRFSKLETKLANLQVSVQNLLPTAAVES